MNDNLPARPDSKTGQSQSPKGGVESRSGETNIGFTVICCILNVKQNGYAPRMADRDSTQIWIKVAFLIWEAPL